MAIDCRRPSAAPLCKITAAYSKCALGDGDEWCRCHRSHLVTSIRGSLNLKRLLLVAGELTVPPSSHAIHDSASEASFQVSFQEDFFQLFSTSVNFNVEIPALRTWPSLDFATSACRRFAAAVASESLLLNLMCDWKLWRRALSSEQVHVTIKLRNSASSWLEIMLVHAPTFNCYGYLRLWPYCIQLEIHSIIESDQAISII